MKGSIGSFAREKGSTGGCYAGYYYNEETGLYYLKSRYYSPTLGRFLTKDSYGFIQHGDPQTLNLYAYCNNNPVNYTDPTGHWLYEGEKDDLKSYLVKTDLDRMEQLGNLWNAAESNPDLQAEYHREADQFREKAENAKNSKIEQARVRARNELHENPKAEAIARKVLSENPQSIGTQTLTTGITDAVRGGYVGGPGGAFIGFHEGIVRGAITGYIKNRFAKWFWK